VASARDELSQDGAAGAAMATAAVEEGTDVGLGSLLAAVSAERTKASLRQDIGAPVALAGEVRHKKP
jgi:hypothetical protein